MAARTSALANGATLAVLCVLAAAATSVVAQTCLPGQTPCVNTCCETNKNFTCCPYNGGYCAAPDQICCVGASNGTCVNTDTCCDGGCATPQQECCQDAVCDAQGQCCEGTYDADWFCRDADQTCCTSSPPAGAETWPTAFAVGASDKCCSVLTSRQCSGDNNFPEDAVQDALQSGCAPGTVCCPSAPLIGSDAVRRRREQSLLKPLDYTSSACGGSLDANPFFPKVKFSAAKPLSGGATPCADPTSQFCCGGMGCPTETLCCPGDADNYGDGCCFGFASKDYSCQDGAKSVCPTSLSQRKPR